nr:hypothetical protein [Tanacetum cinerariifolium]
MLSMWRNSNRVACESSIRTEKNDGTNCQARTKGVNSRYKSPTTPRRYPSPSTPKTVTARTVSTERKRPTTPQLPSRPSTPVRDTYVNMEPVVRKADSLWPSRTRSLNVAFQSDSFSLSSGKKEKPPPQALADRTSKLSSNASRKATSERKRSPLKGKNAIAQSENSKPLEGLQSRLVDQHRWPSTTGSNILNKKIDVPDHKPMKTFIPPNRFVLEKCASDPVRLKLNNFVPSCLSSRSQSLPAGVARPPSPNKLSASSSKRPISPDPFRGASPSRVRPASPLRQPCDSNKVSVLTFVADIKKGKKVADQIEDAHYLRLLYNRQIQWRFVNACAEAALKSQNLTAEKSLYNVWRSTSEVRDSVAAKRTELDQLRLRLKLYSVLHEQMDNLNGWASVEKEHNLSLSGAIKDLESSTLRLPITEGASVYVQTLKSSLCSAIQVMHTMGSSIHSTLSDLEESSSLVSELATVTAQERALLDECEVLMVSAASLQAKENSLRTHLVQLKSLEST